jgi:apolipoprotein N-acyltransferase
MQTDAYAYPWSGRALAGLLVAASRLGALVLIGLVLFADLRLENPLRLLRAFVGLCLAPGLAAWLVARAFAATIRVAEGALVIDRRGERIEVPCRSIADVRPWTVPLPSSGVALRLASGRRFAYGLQIDDPDALAAAVADAGGAASVRAAARHPAARYAAARGRWRSRWRHGLLAFPVFALVPTVPLFRLHQWIVFGGTFGEYYTYGLRAYLLGFAIYWATLTIALVLYAAVLRALAEAIAMPATWIAPARADGIRRCVEIADRVLYYGGVPALLAWVYVQSR